LMHRKLCSRAQKTVHWNAHSTETMKQTFTILAVVLALLGFVMPMAWAGALVCGIIAAGSRPEGYRADGKRKTGGLFGGLWDDASVSLSTKECPFCRSRIPKSAAKCPRCGERV